MLNDDFLIQFSNKEGNDSATLKIGNSNPPTLIFQYLPI